MIFPCVTKYTQCSEVVLAYLDIVIIQFTPSMFFLNLHIFLKHLYLPSFSYSHYVTLFFLIEQ